MPVCHSAPLNGTGRTYAQLRIWPRLQSMDEVYRVQAEVLKTLANPKRLEIIHLLAEEPREVSRLAEELGISQPNVSQHLALMRSAGIVEAERDGREVRYRLSDPEVIVACETMRGVLMRRLSRMSLAATRTPAEVVAGRAAAAGPNRPIS
jgi:DNA-binding transcriptional ArsR family regulator